MTSGIVSVSAAYLYSSPDYESSIETQELMGSVVEVTEADGYWLKITTSQPYTAWTTDLTVVQLSDKELSEYLKAPKYIVVSNISAVYQTPETDSPQISDLVLGDILRISRADDGTPLEENGRLGVILPDGRSGWTPAGDLAEEKAFIKRVKRLSPQERVQEVLRYALSMNGVPYLWGGMTPKGLDCSGLTRLCYLMAGEKLPRNASQQVKCGKEIPLNFDGQGRVNPANLLPGDLLFFSKTPVGNVSHVAIYLGEGKMIHSSQIVRINSILKGDSDCYEHIERLSTARRIIHY